MSRQDHLTTAALSLVVAFLALSLGFGPTDNSSGSTPNLLAFEDAASSAEQPTSSTVPPGSDPTATDPALPPEGETTSSAPTSTVQSSEAPATTAPSASAPAPTEATLPPTSAPATTSPTAAPTSAAPATSPVAPPPQAPDSSGFIKPGQPLPSDAECAARVQPSPETRAGNTAENTTKGGPVLTGPERSRVTGDFTGTTDEIIQWAACKWGVPADVARAQVSVESWWRSAFVGDWTQSSDRCAPGHDMGTEGRDGECPESIGLLQVKWRFYTEAFPGVDDSSAYNVDFAYSVWRGCYEGRETWLNDKPRPVEYAAGDAWGCIGRWFSGSWWTEASQTYVDKVNTNLETRVWESPDFLGHG